MSFNYVTSQEASCLSHSLLQRGKHVVNLIFGTLFTLLRCLTRCFCLLPYPAAGSCCLRTAAAGSRLTF